MPRRGRMGSPPQVRGKLFDFPACTAGIRITPAGAGKTHITSIFREIFQDHPRRCGENPVAQRCEWSRSGSPPQVRGKRGSRPHAAAHRRITPAGAGKTPPGGMLRLPEQDHPRRCGENQRLNLIDCVGVGSPPQVRGKRPGKVFQQSDTGITPAGAGKTRQDCRFVGEKQGSPPQVRGKLNLDALQTFEPRITPAGAGKTCVGVTGSRHLWDHPRRCGENTKKIL